MMWSKTPKIPTEAEALPGREARMPVPAAHFVNRHPLQPPFPEGLARAMFGMGCFWGAEKIFWQLPGVYSTAVGYAAGHTPNPSYREVCSGMTGHTEVVLVVFDPQKVSVRGAAQGVLGEPRSDPGHAARPRRRYAIPIRRVPASTRSSSARRRRRETCINVSCRTPALGRLRRRFYPRRSFTTPRTITSSTWPRIPAATAGSVARASAVQLVWPAIS